MKEELQRLPLNALQAFAAVARLGSVRAAAESLFVTHGAVSQQLKKLEAHLDISLVERHGRGIKLSPAGKQLAAQITPLLQQLGAATREIDPKTESGLLSIACTQDAMHWLLYQLQDFSQRYPSITLEFHNIPKGCITPPEVDLAIMDVLPSHSGYGFTVLTQQRLFPVAHPDLFHDQRESPSTWPLVHEDKGELWSKWFKEADISLPRTGRQLYLPNVIAILIASKKGLGVALASEQEAADELSAGTLIRLSQQEVDFEIPGFVVSPNENMSRKAHLFSDWLKERSAET